MLYDTSLFYLGGLCKNGHKFEGQEQSLRIKSDRSCRQCKAEYSLRAKEAGYVGSSCKIRYPAKPGVYALLNSVTGNAYIGSTHNLSWRWSMHKSNLRSGKHCNPNIQNDFQLYGLNSFSFMILEVLDSANECKNVEEIYLNCVDCSYNISKSPFARVAPMPIEAAKRMGKTKIGNQYWVGRSHSESTKTKISQAKKPEGYCFVSPAGQVVHVANLAEFARQNPGLERRHLSSVANGRLRQHKGWTAYGSDRNGKYQDQPEQVVLARV